MAALAAPAAVPAPVARYDYDSAEVVQTIKQTVAKGATDAQLRMFLEVCRRTGLDPFLKEIWYVPEKGIIMAGRDGYLRVANEHPMFDGMETRVERDRDGRPVKATCSVWRKDRNHPITCEAYYSEYVKTSPVWRQYPSAMIGKVAEVLSLKRSFSINGVVTEEEIGQGGGEERGSAAAAQAVAEAKIAAMRRANVQQFPQPAAEIIDAIPEPDFLEPPPEEDDTPYEIVDGDDHGPDSELQRELRDSIILAEARKNPDRPLPTHYQMLQAFADIKKRYQNIGFERTYYQWLANYGRRHSNEFDDTGEARACYKQMSLDVAEREAKAARRR